MCTLLSRLLTERPLIFMAAIFGISLTAGVIYDRWNHPISILRVSALAILMHFLPCSLYSLLAESVVEDVVKSFVIVAGGALLLHRIPILGLLIISASLPAPVANYTVRQSWGK